MDRHERRTRSIPAESCRLGPTSANFCIPALCRSHPLHSFTTIALAAGDQGALWVSGIGPQVLQEIQNDKIVTQLRDLPVDCAYRDPSGVFWFATPSSVYRVDHERLDAIGSKPGSGHLPLPWRCACGAGTDTAPTRSANTGWDRSQYSFARKSYHSGPVGQVVDIHGVRNFSTGKVRLDQPREPGWSGGHRNCGIYRFRRDAYGSDSRIRSRCWMETESGFFPARTEFR